VFFFGIWKENIVKFQIIQLVVNFGKKNEKQKRNDEKKEIFEDILLLGRD
jgi:hypothetical protein